ncbi:MAG: hypothetical protein JSS82_00275 [Bacteroidetes bacterium]|nr:hypothetical protein [Bacteroidota bacterium]
MEGLVSDVPRRGSGSSRSASSTASFFGISLSTILLGFALAVAIYTLVILNGNTEGYSNHQLESKLNDLRRDFNREIRRAIHNITELQTLLNCTQCIDGILYITNIHTNGTIVVYNSSSGTYFNIVNYTIDLGVTVDEQGAEITDINNTVTMILTDGVPTDEFRLEISDFILIDGLYPNVTFVPFRDAGIFSYIINGSDVFDTSNNTYALVNKEALVSGSFGIYYAANGTDPNLLCMLFPYLNSSIFMNPPLIGAGNQAGNLTALGFPFDHAGTVNGAGQFKATVGMELNIQCTAVEPQPFAITPSSFFSLKVNYIVP